MSAIQTIKCFPRIVTGLAILFLVVTATVLRAQTRPNQSPPPTTQPAATATEPQPEPVKVDTDTKVDTGADTKADAKDADPQPRREPTASEILRALTRDSQAPAKPVTRPTRPGQTRRNTVSPSALPPNAIGQPRAKLLPDGYRLVDRPGRMTREGDQWTFSFEGRGTGTPELPIRLLPNRLLEDMENFSAGGTKPVVFIVSGEVTEYHGVNYLLIQKLLTRPNLGNLQ